MSQVFGASVKRREDPRLITGTGHFTEDMALPRMASVVFLRSPYAHAKIKEIKTDNAKSQPGVIAVFTGRDTQLAAIPTAWPVTGSDLKPTKYPRSRWIKSAT